MYHLNDVQLITFPANQMLKSTQVHKWVKTESWTVLIVIIVVRNYLKRKMLRHCHAKSILQMHDAKRSIIHLLDGQQLELTIQPRLVVHELLNIIASHVALKDADKQYFGLAYVDHLLVWCLFSSVFPNFNILHHHQYFSIFFSYFKKPHPLSHCDTCLDAIANGKFGLDQIPEAWFRSTDHCYMAAISNHCVSWCHNPLSEDLELGRVGHGVHWKIHLWCWILIRPSCWLINYLVNMVN